MFPQNVHLVAHKLHFHFEITFPHISHIIEDVYISLAVILSHFNFRDPQLDMDYRLRTPI